MNKKEVKALQDEDIERVAGGEFDDTRCITCGEYYGRYSCGGYSIQKYVTPVSSKFYICNDCIKKKRELMGDAGFAAWLAKLSF